MSAGVAVPSPPPEDCVGVAPDGVAETEEHPDKLDPAEEVRLEVSVTAPLPLAPPRAGLPVPCRLRVCEPLPLPPPLTEALGDTVAPTCRLALEVMVPPAGGVAVALRCPLPVAASAEYVPPPPLPSAFAEVGVPSREALTGALLPALAVVTEEPVAQRVAPKLGEPVALGGAVDDALPAKPVRVAGPLSLPACGERVATRVSVVETLPLSVGARAVALPPSLAEPALPPEPLGTILLVPGT